MKLGVSSRFVLYRKIHIVTTFVKSVKNGE